MLKVIECLEGRFFVLNLKMIEYVLRYERSVVVCYLITMICEILILTTHLQSKLQTICECNSFYMIWLYDQQNCNDIG